MSAARTEFRALYEAELDYVFQTLRRLGVAGADLEDVAHDVFVVAFKRRADRDPSRPVRPWLFGISYRVVGNYLTKAHRRRELPSDDVDRSRDERSPAQVAEDREFLIAAMDVLDLAHRAPLVLHDVEGMTAPAIAELLDIPTNTVYSRIRSARSKLLARVAELQGASI